MKKLLKRILALMLLLVLNSSFPVQAQSTREIDIQLKKQGAPQYLIDILPRELKFKIYNEGLVFESCKKETKTFYNENITSGTGDVSIMGTISSSTLELIPSYWSDFNGNKQLLVFYNWLNSPFWNLTDELAISWNGSKYYVEQNSWSSTMNYDVYINNQRVTVKRESSSDIAELKDYGAKWTIPLYANIEPYKTNDVYAWGYVGLKLIRRFTSDGTKEQYFTTYLHKKIVPSVSLSLSSSSIGIGISGVGSYDTLATWSDLYDY